MIIEEMQNVTIELWETSTYKTTDYDTGKEITNEDRLNQKATMINLKVDDIKFPLYVSYFENMYDEIGKPTTFYNLKINDDLIISFKNKRISEIYFREIIKFSEGKTSVDTLGLNHVKEEYPECLI